MAPPRLRRVRRVLRAARQQQAAAVAVRSQGAVWRRRAKVVRHRVRRVRCQGLLRWASRLLVAAVVHPLARS